MSPSLPTRCAAGKHVRPDDPAAADDSGYACQRCGGRILARRRARLVLSSAPPASRARATAYAEPQPSRQVTLGRLHLLLGDGLAWLRQRPISSVDGIFTDPPWGVGPDIAGQDRWLDLIRDMCTAAWHVLRPGGRMLIWLGANRFGPAARVIDSMHHFLGWITVRRIPPAIRGRMVLAGDVVLVYGRNPGIQPVVPRASMEKTHASRGHPDTTHPCARPFDIAQRIIADWFAPGETIVDPFGGSGTLALAASELGMDAYSIEIDPRWHAEAELRARARTPRLPGIDP